MAIPVEVELEVERTNETGYVVHEGPSGEVTRLTIDDAMHDLSAAVVFATDPVGGVRIKVRDQAPYRSGIGGSSTYGVALAKAMGEIVGRPRSEERLVSLVRDLEARLLETPTGEQDHWAAVRGGVLALHLEPGGGQVENLPVDADWLAERVIVFFSGLRHHSGAVNWKVIRRRLDGDRGTIDAFRAISEAARDCRKALLDLDEDGVSAAIRREWKARRRLVHDVSTPELDDLVTVAKEAGATAAKACGAGGGGSVVVWHPPGVRDDVIAALDYASEDGRVLALGAAAEGCRLLDPTPGS